MANPSLETAASGLQPTEDHQAQTLCLLDIQQVVLYTIHYFDLVIIDYNHLYNVT